MNTSQQTQNEVYEEVTRRRTTMLLEGIFPILVCKNEGYWILDHFDRRILTRAEWLEICANVEAFYDTYSDGSIEDYNREVQGLRQKEATQYREESQKVKPPKSGYIYLIHGVETSWYKIGQSVSPKVRLSQLGTQGPFQCKLLHCFAVTDMDSAENRLHQHFNDKRVEGEWFELDADDVAMIRGLDADSISTMVNSDGN